MIGWIIGIIILVALVLIIWYISEYNSFIALKNNIDNAWKDIDVNLQKRFDKIPNLVNTVKGYMKHERETLKGVTQARSSWNKAKSPNKKMQASSMLTSALGSFFAVAEQYPKLMANENFKHLQNEITLTEDEIADFRSQYNNLANAYNIKREQFPSMLVANIMKLKKIELFQVAEPARKAVKVQF